MLSDLYYTVLCYYTASRMLLTVVPVFLATASVPLSPDQQATLYRTFVLLLKYVLLVFHQLPPTALHASKM